MSKPSDLIHINIVATFLRLYIIILLVFFFIFCKSCNKNHKHYFKNNLFLYCKVSQKYVILVFYSNLSGFKGETNIL